MKSLPQWSATVLLTAPLGAWALGLGDIELQSALNQPLRAEIELLSVTPEDLDGLRVGLASRATFERYELDLTSELTGLEFTVDRNAAGRYVVRVTSRQPMANPFLTFLVEATWPRGRLLREYTVLLDPPVFTPEIGAEPPVRQAEAGARSEGSGVFARPTQPATSQASPSQSPARQTPAGTPAPRTDAAAAAALAAGAYGPVQSSETLWSIASRLRPAGVTVNQMMVALYEANPNAFDGNMNVLLRGATLMIPDRDAMTALSADEATAIVRRAEESWRGTASADAGDARLASADGARGASTAAAGGADEPRLRLVPPSAESLAAASASSSSPNAAAGGAGGADGADGSASDSAEVARLEAEIVALRAELEESRRLLQLREQSLEALQARLAAADSLPAAAPTETETSETATAPGVDLEVPIDEEPLFADELDGADATAEADTAESEPEPEPVTSEAAPAAASATTPTPQPAAVRTPTPPEPTLLSRVLGAISNPFLLIGLGIGAVLLTAVWYLRNRREDADDVTGRWDALDVDDTVVDEPAEPTRRLRAVDDASVVVDEDSLTSEAAAAAVAAAQPKSDAEEIEDTLSSHTVINLDQGDVLAEADFHMAYGLYDQAAELVQKALESEPDRRDLKLKLLEVYFVWGNKDAFREAASALRAETQGGSDWDKVLIMGKQLCPDDPLFAESTTGGSGAVDVDLEGTGGPTEIDFPFDEKTQIADVDSLDFELAATGERMYDDAAGADDDGDADEDTGVDDMLEIGAQTAAGLEAALLSTDDDDDEETGRTAAEPGDDDTARAFADVIDEDETGTSEEPDFEGVDALGEPTDIELESLAATQESPTVESETQGFGEDWRAALGLDDSDGNTDLDLEALVDPDAPTMETPWASAASDADSPTMESPWGPTVETPTIESLGPDAPTVETPTIESPSANTALLRVASGETAEMPTVETTAPGEFTEEIDIGDLGLSVEDLSGLPDDIGSLPGVDTGDTREQPALGADDDLLSATGVTKIVDTSDDDDLETTGTAVLDDGDETLLAGTEVLERGVTARGTAVLEGLGPQPAAANGDSGLDLDLDDLAGALGGGDTMEQPRAAMFDTEIFGNDESTPVDLDVGVDETVEQSAVGGPLDPHTMTEIGTKLDLARAYIDMGDPEGARSILEEVLDEGDAGQRREAQGLIDALAGN
ncbi:MAG TPA: FimV/HubP family polar landmark protein [Gammaproteobacteria bacterium]